MSAVAIGLLMLAIWGFLSLNSGVSVRSFEQHASDSVTSDLNVSSVAQSFRSPNAGLSSIDVQLGSKADLTADSQVRLLAGDGPNGTPVYESTLKAASFDKNPFLTIAFPPIANSKDQTYTLLIETPGRPLSTAIGIQYNSFDTLSSGSMYLDGQPVTGDIAFSAYYRYDLSMLWGDIADALSGNMLLVISWLAFLLLPGLAILVWLPNSLSTQQRVLAAPGLSILTLAVFLLVTRAVGIHLGTVSMWLLLVACALAVGAGLRRRGPQPGPQPQESRLNDFAFWGSLLSVLAMTLFSRLISIKDIYAGVGLDAYHHTLISQMIVRSGGIPATYEPFADLVSFTYHYGFHAMTAALAWLSGRTSPTDLMALMPQAGQIGGTLPVLALTLFGWKVIGNRWMGLLAGALTGLACVVPAFYVNWSRFTQGLGLALAPVAWVFLLELLEKPISASGTQPIQLSIKTVTWRSAANQSAPYLLAVISAAGLFLSHYRITVIYAAFAGIYLLWRTSQIKRGQPLSVTLAPFWRAGIAGALTLAVILPWLVNLKQNFVINFTGRDVPNIADYYSTASRLGPAVLNHPTVPLLALLGGLALVLFGWRETANRRLGATVGGVAGLVGIAFAVYVYGSHDPTKLDAEMRVFQLGLSPVVWVLFILAAALAVLVLMARGRSALILLPSLTWVLLGIWSNPVMLPVRLPYSGYLDSVTLASGAWLPVTLLGGYFIHAAGVWVLSLGKAYQGLQRTAWSTASPLLMGAAALFALAASGLSLAPIHDNQLYVERADYDALVWMRDNLPRNAYVMANPFAFPWSPDSVLGSDAGLWIPLVAGLPSSVPPMTAYNERSKDQNYLASRRDIIGAEPLKGQPPNWQALKDAGITHIFIGSRGGALSIPDLLKTDHARLVFHEDAVYIFQLQ